MPEEKACGCGCGGARSAADRQTRRDFLRTVAAGLATASLTAGVTLGAGAIPPAATPVTPIDEGGGGGDVCQELYQICMDQCMSDNVPWYEQAACTIGCRAEWVLCKAEDFLRRLRDAIEEGMRWLAEHPEVVVGAIIIIGGIALVVATGPGGALVLVAA